MSHTHYRGFHPRQAPLPLRRGAIDPSDEVGMAAIVELVGDAPLPPVVESAAEPFVGITTDGTARPELLSLPDGTAAAQDTRGPVAAALRLLEAVGPGHRDRLQLPMGAPEWRMWSNAFLTFPEHGLLLDELAPATRGSALALVRSSLGAAGYDRARRAMQLNAGLGRLLEDRYPDTLSEFCYWITVFGEPATDRPWGWQLQGHHVDLHCVFVDGAVALTPAFLGCEFDGEDLFPEHRTRAVELMAQLPTAQRDRALLHGSMLAADLPPALAGIVDGRHRAGAGRDNLVLPYEGLCAMDLTPGRQELLLSLLDLYVENLPEPARTARAALLRRHIGETHLSWIGPHDGANAFYYRVHSPAILVEYDNHSGVFLDNDEPEPFHVHTIVRTPNGGDYGYDLLAEHYAAQRH